MGDEEHRQAEALAQVVQQVDDLRLDRDVERRDRLVGDDEARLDGERAGDADALPLPAGELVRIAPRVLGREADQREQLGDPRRARRAGMQAVGRQRLAERVADAQARVEARVRVLEDDLQAAPKGPHRARRQRREVDALEDGSAPAVGSISFSTERPIVLLPEPDSPTRPSTSPGAISKLTSSTARTGRSLGPKYFFSPRTRQHRRRALALTRAPAHAARALRRRRPRPAAASPASHSGPDSAQRGSKAQPGGGSSGLATWPGIAFRRRSSPARGVVEPRAAGRRAGRACTDARRANSVAHVALLDDAARVHHDDAVGDLGDDAEIVGNEQHRHADLALQLVEQVEDLRLDRDVERGRRLVGDQQHGIAGERHRDHHALAHAARQLVRIVGEALLRGRDLDQLEHLERALRRAAAWSQAEMDASPPRRSGRRP